MRIVSRVHRTMIKLITPPIWHMLDKGVLSYSRFLDVVVIQRCAWAGLATFEHKWITHGLYRLIWVLDPKPEMVPDKRRWGSTSSNIYIGSNTTGFIHPKAAPRLPCVSR